MGISLIAPLFLAGLAALAVPILVHLSARNRRDVVRFPSLKFLTRLPYRQAKRQRLRYRFLFAMRALAIFLLVLAFTRPFFDHSTGSGLGSGGRDVVIALDRSYSMAYDGTWERASDAVREVVAGLPAGSRLSLITFAEEASIEVPLSSDPQAMLEALDRLTPGSGRTRFAPALRLADEILLDSTLAEREVFLVSDLQAAGWDRSADSDKVVLSPGVTLEMVYPVPVAPNRNAQIAAASLRQTRTDDGIALTVTAQLANRGTQNVEDLPVSLDWQAAEASEVRRAEPSTFDRTARVDDLAPSENRAIDLGPVVLPSATARATVRIGDDALAPDNAFHLLIASDTATEVLLIEAPETNPESSLYLRRALTVATQEAEDSEPADAGSTFDLRLSRASTVRPADIATASVVILHDSPFPSGAAGQALVEHIEAGGGLWVILGSRSRPPQTDLAARLPGVWDEPADRLEGQGVGLSGIDYRHPVFEIFAGAGDGNLAAPRFYRYRPIELGSDGAALARTSDGAVALAETRVGKGRVMLWGSPFDNRWSDLPVQAVFLPFVHQMCRYLAGVSSLEPWYRVGQALDLRAVAAVAGVEDLPSVALVETPSGLKRETPLQAPLRLEEAGFYQIQVGESVPQLVAVNVDPSEADLTRLDPEALIAASTTLAPTDPELSLISPSQTREQQERRQGLWWFLLLAVLFLLTAESLTSNRRAVEPSSLADV